MEQDIYQHHPQKPLLVQSSIINISSFLFLYCQLQNLNDVSFLFFSCLTTKLILLCGDLFSAHLMA